MKNPKFLDVIVEKKIEKETDVIVTSIEINLNKMIEITFSKGFWINKKNVPNYAFPKFINQYLNKE